MKEPAVVTIAAGPDIGDLHESVVEAAREAAIDDCDSVEVLAETTAARDITARVARWIGQAAGSQAVPYSVRGAEELTVRTAARSVMSSRSRASTRPVSPCTIAVSAISIDPERPIGDGDYVLGLFTRGLPPHQQLVQRSYPDPIAVMAANAVTAAPLLCVAVCEAPCFAVAVMSIDPVATEVIARAVRFAIEPAGAAGGVPWEAAIVQRTTELLPEGAVRPSDIRIVPRWFGPAEHPAHRSFHAMTQRALERAGVRPAPDRPA